MRKIMLIGRTGSGKTTITQALMGREMKYEKTQSLKFEDFVIDTPGEYIENKGYYKALIISAVDCDIIGFVQDALDKETVFPPNFSQILNKPAIGIITKSDLTKDYGNAEFFLKEAGAKEMLYVNCKKKSTYNGIIGLLKE